MRMTSRLHYSALPAKKLSRQFLMFIFSSTGILFQFSPSRFFRADADKNQTQWFDDYSRKSLSLGMFAKFSVNSFSCRSACCLTYSLKRFIHNTEILLPLLKSLTRKEHCKVFQTRQVLAKWLRYLTKFKPNQNLSSFF